MSDQTKLTKDRRRTPAGPFEYENELPAGFLEARAGALHRLLPGPSLIRLADQRGSLERPLFVSALLHGNEETGLLAVQRLLRKYQRNEAKNGFELHRPLFVFVGNILAARAGRRFLQGQADYNRIWPGTEHEAGADAPYAAEIDMAARVTERLRAAQPFASIDIHNNTGTNPHYGCINRLDDEFLHLAALFGRTVVYFRRPKGVQSIAFSEFCPAITIECGHSGDEAGTQHAFEFLDAVLRLSEFPAHPPAKHDIEVYHTVARLFVPQEHTFAFGPGGTDIILRADLDHLNFRELDTGEELATLQADARIYVRGEYGDDVTDEFLTHTNGRIRLAKPAMPSMFTLDPRIVRQDCLGYLMERVDLK